MQGNLLEGWREPSPKDLNELYTPPSLFAAWHQALNFTVDAFSCETAAKLSRYWTKADDAFSKDWRAERVFANPPYDSLEEFASKADEAMRFDGCELVLGLLHGGRAEQPWWQDYIEPFRDHRRLRRIGDRLLSVSTINVRKRIVHGTPECPSGIGLRGSGTFPSVLVLWSFREAEWLALLNAETERSKR